MLGKHNPADLVTKHLDQGTSEGHTHIVNYEFMIGRAKEAPKLYGVWRSVGEHLLNKEQNEWKYMHLLIGWYGGRAEQRCQPTSKRLVGMFCKYKSRKCQRRESKGNEKCGIDVEEERATVDGLRAAGAPGNQLVGTGVQRFECRPAYQPWGSNLTFQPKAGVSWVQGLRHGVAMHPRGRHLREGMTLLPTWENHTWNVNSSLHHNNK